MTSWIAEKVWRRMHERTPILLEWGNDVPRYPVFPGEVAQAEATLASLTGPVVTAAPSKP